MQRVMVIGSGGAGKSAFAEQLAARTGLPLHHLDTLYWRPGWVEPPKEEWVSTMDALIAGPQWILDGNFGGTMGQRLAACDTVIFIDTPAVVCLWRIILRRIRNHGRARPDMTAGCNERLSPGFILWILGYPFQRRPGILRQLDSLRVTKQVAVLRTSTQAQNFLEAATRIVN